MRTFSQQIAALQGEGYALAEAQAKVAHDAILYAIGKSGFKPIRIDISDGSTKSPLRTKIDIAALGRIFKSKRFVRDMSSPKSNWLKESPEKVSAGLISFLTDILS